jgi:hypothetical protein
LVRIDVGRPDRPPTPELTLSAAARAHQAGHVEARSRTSLNLVGGGELIRTGELLFGVAAAEADHRQITIGDEPLQVGDHPVVVVTQQRRRGDVASADLHRPVQQELDQAALMLEGRANTVHCPHAKRDVIGQ